jgi:LysR family transcriptional regulator, glycine cleavage system transcriptional activator
MFDVVIRGGPDTVLGFSSRFLLAERRLPVCSPALLAQLPLDEIADLSRHTLLPVTLFPRLLSSYC